MLSQELLEMLGQRAHYFDGWINETKDVYLTDSYGNIYNLGYFYTHSKGDREVGLKMLQGFRELVDSLIENYPDIDFDGVTAKIHHIELQANREYARLKEDWSKEVNDLKTMLQDAGVVLVDS